MQKCEILSWRDEQNLLYNDMETFKESLEAKAQKEQYLLAVSLYCYDTSLGHQGGGL